MSTTLPVRVTVTLGSRTVPIEEVADARIAGPMRNAAQDVAKRLAAIRCPVHHKAATNVHVHFDQRGAADLRYESCCAKLGEQISRVLG